LMASACSCRRFILISIESRVVMSYSSTIDRTHYATMQGYAPRSDVNRLERGVSNNDRPKKERKIEKRAKTLSVTATFALSHPKPASRLRDPPYRES
jgi:hypothetical protein